MDSKPRGPVKMGQGVARIPENSPSPTSAPSLTQTWVVCPASTEANDFVYIISGLLSIWGHYRCSQEPLGLWTDWAARGRRADFRSAQFPPSPTPLGAQTCPFSVFVDDGPGKSRFDREILSSSFACLGFPLFPFRVHYDWFYLSTVEVHPSLWADSELGAPPPPRRPVPRQPERSHHPVLGQRRRGFT